MTEPITDQRLYSLRDDIVEAGESVRTLRKGVLWAIIALFPLTAVLFELGMIRDGPMQSPTPFRDTVSYLWSSVGPSILLAVVVSLLLAIPLAAGYRRLQRSALRRRIEGVPTAELAAVLLPLQNEKLGDTRKVVAALMRDLRVTDTELVPAEPIPGSGTEPAPSPPSPS